MSFTNKNLLQDEHLIYIGRVHWIVFIPAIVLLACGVAINKYLHSPLQSYAVIFAGLIYGLYTLLDYMTSEFGVTDKRVITKTGIFGRQTRELFLTKIEGIQLQQDIVGRLFNYGAVIPSGTGGDKANLHKYINNPLQLKTKIEELIKR